MENLVRMMNKTFWQDRKALITGIGGLLGAHLGKELLENGSTVIGLIRDEDPCSNHILQGIADQIITVRGDVMDCFLMTRILNEYGIDTVFHLAAQTIVTVANRSPLSTFESNIKGTWCVLEASRICKTVGRVVVASSDKAYGQHDQLPYLETHALNGMHPYDASKVCVDVLSRCYYKTYGLPVALTRFANLYGEGDLNFSRIVPDAIRSVITDCSPIIRSDGTPLRDYVYVKDAVQGYGLLAENLEREEIKGEAFNFGTGSPIAVLSLVNMIIDISGKKHIRPKILGMGKLVGEIQDQYLDSSKARSLLGWQPKWSLREGLGKTFQWYEQFLKKRIKCPTSTSR
jgi:CDP-glucose 4,6-dehydratase